MFLFGHFPAIARFEPLHGGQIGNGSVCGANGDSHEDIGEVIVNIDVVELTGLDDRIEDGHALSAFIGLHEHPVFAPHGQIADHPLADAVIDRQITPIQESTEFFPVVQQIIDGLSDTALGQDRDPWGIQACFNLVHNRPAQLLAQLMTHLDCVVFCRSEPLDAVELADKPKDGFGILDAAFDFDRLDKLPSGMHHAGHLDQAVAFDRIVIAWAAIGHEVGAGIDAFEKLTGRGGSAGFSVVKYGGTLLPVHIHPHVACVGGSFNTRVVGEDTSAFLDLLNHFVIDSPQGDADLGDPPHHCSTRKPDAGLVEDLPLYPVQGQVILVLAENDKQKKFKTRQYSWDRSNQGSIGGNDGVFAFSCIDVGDVDMLDIGCGNPLNDDSMHFTDFDQGITTVGGGFFLFIGNIDDVFLSLDSIGDDVTAGMSFSSAGSLDFYVFVFGDVDDDWGDLIQKSRQYGLGVIGNYVFFAFFAVEFFFEEPIVIDELLVLQHEGPESR